MVLLCYEIRQWTLCILTVFELVTIILLALPVVELNLKHASIPLIRLGRHWSHELPCHNRSEER